MLISDSGKKIGFDNCRRLTKVENFGSSIVLPIFYKTPSSLRFMSSFFLSFLAAFPADITRSALVSVLLFCNA